MTSREVEKVAAVLPAFAAELHSLIRASTRPDLADQLAGLRIVDRCTCGETECAHFYTAPKPSGAYGPGHSNLILDSTRGMVVLDVVGDAIVAIEVLDRPDVKGPLDRYLPLAPDASAG